MAEPIQSPQPGVEPQLLSYRTPVDDAGRASPPIVCAVAIGTALLVFGAIFFSILLMLADGAGPAALLIAAAVVVGLIALAVGVRNRGRGRSVAIGIWIGLGTGLLAQGICWGLLAR